MGQITFIAMTLPALFFNLTCGKMFHIVEWGLVEEDELMGSSIGELEATLAEVKLANAASSSSSSIAI